MLRVRVELIRGGVGEPELLGEMTIANDLFRSLETEGSRGSYRVRCWGKRRRPVRSGRIEDWPRRSKPVWALVRRALEEVGH